MKTTIFIFIFILFRFSLISQTEWLAYEPLKSNDNGKCIVLISGDESYRSEESLPMLARILTFHHGFHTKVLFAINPETGYIDPDYSFNIPGLQFLEDADLLIIQTRFRELPDDQMEIIDGYLSAAKPVIGLRTSTHAFKFPELSLSKFKKYSYNSVEEWEGGFGKIILGETWVSHYGLENEGTRALIDGPNSLRKHPILNGVGVIHARSGVYSTNNLCHGADILCWGASTSTLDSNSPILLNKPIMPVAWTHLYCLDGVNYGKSFTTTLGASIDFLDKNLRKLVVNAVYWTLDMSEKIPSEGSVIDFVGEYDPSMFGFGGFIKNMNPSLLH